jgi:hypothetical protein
MHLFADDSRCGCTPSGRAGPASWRARAGQAPRCWRATSDRMHGGCPSGETSPHGKSRVNARRRELVSRRLRGSSLVCGRRLGLFNEQGDQVVVPASAAGGGALAAASPQVRWRDARRCATGRRPHLDELRPSASNHPLLPLTLGSAEAGHARPARSRLVRSGHEISGDAGSRSPRQSRRCFVLPSAPSGNICGSHEMLALREMQAPTDVAFAARGSRPLRSSRSRCLYARTLPVVRDSRSRAGYRPRHRAGHSCIGRGGRRRVTRPLLRVDRWR